MAAVLRSLDTTLNGNRHVQGSTLRGSLSERDHQESGLPCVTLVDLLSRMQNELPSAALPWGATWDA